MWWLLAIEPLHGLTLTLYMVALVDYFDAAVPPEWRTTSQLLLDSLYQRAGQGVGAAGGGWLMARRGGREVYMLCSSCAAVLFGLHAGLCLVLWMCGRPLLLENEAAATAVPLASLPAEDAVDTGAAVACADGQLVCGPAVPDGQISGQPRPAPAEAEAEGDAHLQPPAAARRVIN